MGAPPLIDMQYGHIIDELVGRVFNVLLNMQQVIVETFLFSPSTALLLNFWRCGLLYDMISV